MNPKQRIAGVSRDRMSRDWVLRDWVLRDWVSRNLVLRERNETRGVCSPCRLGSCPGGISVPAGSTPSSLSPRLQPCLTSGRKCRVIRHIP